MRHKTNLQQSQQGDVFPLTGTAALAFMICEILMTLFVAGSCGVRGFWKTWKAMQSRWRSLPVSGICLNSASI